MLYIRLLVHLVIAFISENYRRPALWGELSVRKSFSIWFTLVLNHCNISKGIKGGETIIRGSGKDYVIKLWILDDVGYDIDTR